jgi:hypothetical protein
MPLCLKRATRAGPEFEQDAWVQSKPNRIFVCITSMEEIEHIDPASGSTLQI